MVFLVFYGVWDISKIERHNLGMERFHFDSCVGKKKETKIIPLLVFWLIQKERNNEQLSSGDSLSDNLSRRLHFRPRAFMGGCLLLFSSGGLIFG
ncbi:hypothetical protein BT93_K0069 [Corymbia citriodora subsp. variegata]|nr:hypothetical protein BT93_K0069 [Corymbia citriodora subsp. variegata]